MAEWAQLRLQRKQYASLRPRSADAAKYIITKYIIPDQEKFLTTLQSHPDDVRTLLQQTRESIVVKPGETVTNRMVCATYVVDQVYSVLQNLAVGALNSDNLSSFLLYFDVADGVMEAVVSIYTGEAELNGVTADRQREGYALRGEYELTPLPPFVRQAGDQYEQAAVARILSLLQQDPTGCSVVDDAVESMKVEASGKPIDRIGSIESFQVPEFVVAGAEFGRQVYKEISGIARNVHDQ